MLLVSDDINPSSRTFVERVVIAVPLTVAPETPVAAAIAQMHKTHTSYVVITQQRRPVGIFTEQDLVQWVATSQLPTQPPPLTPTPTAMPISGVMSSIKPLALKEVSDADKIFQQMRRDQIRYLPVVDQHSQLVGVITPDSLLNGGESDRPTQCWRIILEKIDLAAFGLDSTGKLTYVNPYLLKLMGYSAVAMVGQDWCECFIPTAERSQLREYFQQLFNQPDAPLQCQSTVLSLAGVEHSVAWHNTLIKNSQGIVVNVLCIGKTLNDISDRFVFDQLRRDFVSLVSHELRTPLTAVHGSIQLVSQGLVDSQSKQGQQLLQIAAEGSQRLVTLMNRILELEQLESDQQPLQKGLINSHSLTYPLVHALQVIASQRELTLTVSDPGMQIVADGDRLSEVLTHLLDNAIKFSPNCTTIGLTVTAIRRSEGSPEAIRFAVCDQGPGISAEQCEQIFERFVQLDASNARQTAGLGLGLATCRHIVKQHGGSLQVKSSPGGGSCFYFTLPMS